MVNIKLDANATFEAETQAMNIIRSSDTINSIKAVGIALVVFGMAVGMFYVMEFASRLGM